VKEKELAMPKLNLAGRFVPKPGIASNLVQNFPPPQPPKTISVDDLETLRSLVGTIQELPGGSGQRYKVVEIQNVTTGDMNEVNIRPTNVIVEYQWPK
jgi:hypothetical protein